MDDILGALANGWEPREVAEELVIPLEAVYEALRYASETIKKLKEHIRSKGLDYASDALERYTNMLHEFEITILKDYADPYELLETMRKYRLTPSDAIISSDMQALWHRHYSHLRRRL